MATNLLSAAACKNAASNGASIRKLHDGDGLYLWAYRDGRKYWRFRYWEAGKEKSLSAGVYQTMPQCSHHKPSFRRSLGVALVDGEAASARSAVTPARFAAQHIA